LFQGSLLVSIFTGSFCSPSNSARDSNHTCLTARVLEVEADSFDDVVRASRQSKLEFLWKLHGVIARVALNAS
jgi:hypothetical protein